MSTSDPTTNPSEATVPEPAAPDAASTDLVPAFQRFMEKIGGFWTLGVLILLIVVFGIAAV